MLHRHCWHEDKSTRRKIRKPERCKSDNPNYKHLGCCYDYIIVRSIEKCCICNKERIVGRQHDYIDGLGYPDILDNPLTIK